MMRENLISILSEIARITYSDIEVQKEKRLRGEKFNVFNVLGLWSNEVRLHSAFIAELLNVKGSHGLKDAFLKAFLEALIQKQFQDFNFDTLTSQTFVEYYIGPVTENRGGRIDILIKSGSKAIIIENKIYASDQACQLIRYENYAKDNKLEYKILYLTLYGDTASESSAGKNEQGVVYKCISYQKDILQWLERAIELSARQPLVRETIGQYQTLIKQLTNQDMETESKINMITILSSPQNALATASILNLSEQWRATALERLRQKLESWAVENREIEFDVYGTPGTKEYGYLFNKPEWKTMAVFIFTEATNYRDFYIGISNYNGHIKADQEKKQLDCLSNEPTDAWPYGWQRLDGEYKNWSNEIFADMLQYESKLVKYITDSVTVVFDELEATGTDLY